MFNVLQKNKDFTKISRSRQITFIFDVSEFNPSSEQKEIVENCDNLTEFLYLGGKTVHFTQTKLEETLLHLDRTGVSWEWLHQGGVGPYPYSYSYYFKVGQK